MQRRGGVGGGSVEYHGINTIHTLYTLHPVYPASTPAIPCHHTALIHSIYPTHSLHIPYPTHSLHIIRYPAHLPPYQSHCQAHAQSRQPHTLVRPALPVASLGSQAGGGSPNAVSLYTVGLLPVPAAGQTWLGSPVKTTPCASPSR